MQLDNFITVGKVLSSFGLKGQVKVDVYLEDLTVLRLLIPFCRGCFTEEQNQFFKKTKKSIWIAAIPETKNKEQADKLKGHLIYIETKIPPFSYD